MRDPKEVSIKSSTSTNADATAAIVAELNALPVHLKEPVFPWRRLTHATGGPLLIAMAALQVIRSGMNGFGNAADSEAADSEPHKPKQPAD